jgi:hypothetical protein
MIDPLVQKPVSSPLKGTTLHLEMSQAHHGTLPRHPTLSPLLRGPILANLRPVFRVPMLVGMMQPPESSKMTLVWRCEAWL